MKNQTWKAAVSAAAICVAMMSFSSSYAARVVKQEMQCGKCAVRVVVTEAGADSAGFMFSAATAA